MREKKLLPFISSCILRLISSLIRRRLMEKEAIMDEVSGRGAQKNRSQVGTSHPNESNIPCDQCMESGQVVTAAGFCESCTDFLCCSCIELHRKLRVSKDHSVLKGSDMPKQRPISIDTKKCSDHPDRPLEMYCVDQDTLGCAICFLEKHRACQSIDKISNLSKDIKTSSDVSDINQAALNYKELCNRFREIIQEHRLANDNCQAKCLEDYQRFRAEIETALDKMGEEVSRDTSKVQKENTDKLDDLAEMISSYEQEMESLMEDINRGMALDQKQNDQLFIALKKSKKQIMDTVYQLEQLETEKCILEFDFCFDRSIKVLMETECKIRVKRNVQPATRCTNITQISVQSQEDQARCSIYGVVSISDKELILADNNNKCLKLVDVSRNKIVKRHTLPSAPYDVCKLPVSRVAVSLPENQKIQFYTADRNMDSCGGISVDGKCLGLHYMEEDRLAVSYFEPIPQIQIMNLQGRVIQTIKHDISGQKLFSRPEYLTFSAENRLLYVSDYRNDTLTCMDVTGSVQWVYKDEELSGPEGVVIGDSGCLYLCSRNNHTINVVSHDGLKLAVIPQSNSDFMYPFAVCYDSHYQTLYVSIDGRDHGNPKYGNHMSKLRLE